MSQVLLQVRDLKVHFQVDGEKTLLGTKKADLKAVNGVSFDLSDSETIGVVGESGCGKSTLARGILGLVPVTSGQVLWLGRDLTQLKPSAMRSVRKEIQVIFQDPLASLNPRMTVGEIITEPLKVFHPKMGKDQLHERLGWMMKMVGLLPDQINRYPHEFSGGQCQRIGIARALILNPKLVVCDEPVSALDVSIQAQIVNLLMDLQKKLKISLIFIAHDLSVVRHISHRVMVMYLGQVVEIRGRDDIYKQPAHPYTKALIDAVPLPDPKLERGKKIQPLSGDLPSPVNPPLGCNFCTRCPVVQDRCHKEEPELRALPDGSGFVACHFSELLKE